MGTSLFAFYVIVSGTAGSILGFFMVRFLMNNYYEANCKIVEDLEQDEDFVAEDAELLMFVSSIKFFGIFAAASALFILSTMYDFMIAAGPLFFFIFPPIVNLAVSGLLFLAAKLSISFFGALVRIGKYVDILP